jgi:hypothetical protein
MKLICADQQNLPAGMAGLRHQRSNNIPNVLMT